MNDRTGIRRNAECGRFTASGTSGRNSDVRRADLNEHSLIGEGRNVDAGGLRLTDPGLGDGLEIGLQTPDEHFPARVNQNSGGIGITEA